MSSQTVCAYEYCRFREKTSTTTRNQTAEVGSSESNKGLDTPLPDGSPVFLTYVSNQRVAFVRSATAEGKKVYDKAMGQIAEYGKSAQPFNGDIKEHEMLLLSQSGHFHRVIVVASYDSGPALVERIDIGDILQVPQSLLFALSDDLKKLPAFAQKIALNGVAAEPRHLGQVLHLTQLMDNQTELILRYGGGGGKLVNLYKKNCPDSINAQLKQLDDTVQVMEICSMGFSILDEVESIFSYIY